jgi:hypothetical protein
LLLLLAVLMISIGSKHRNKTETFFRKIAHHDTNHSSEYSYWCARERLPGRIPSSEMLLRVALVRTDVLEERIASIIKLTRISENASVASYS